MRNITCPNCGKELINLKTPPEGPVDGEFWCDECKITINIARDTDIPVTIEGDRVKAEWYNAGEGICGDYDPEDPMDENLLRFDISWKNRDEWEEVEDASYCTCTYADTAIEDLTKALYIIYKEYDNVIDNYPEHSLKKLGERLSWINAKEVS